MRPQLKIVLLLVAITLGLLYLSSLTGFYAANGLNWDGQQQVTANSAQQTIIQHVVFGQHKSINCADSIYVQTQDSRPVKFRTANEVYNSDNLCTATDVIFDNIIYKQQPSFGVAGAQSITYNIFYGKIAAAEAAAPQAEPKVEEQPGFQPQGGNCGASITACCTIAGSGTFTLANDILNSNLNPCIGIQVPNVIFDGQGHTIDGQDAGGTYGIYIYYSGGTSLPSGFRVSDILTNVTVKNVTLTDWGYGVAYNNGPSGSISDVNANSNAYGIYLIGSSNSNTLTNNTVSSNQYGIFITGASNNNVFTNNTASSNSNYDVYLANGVTGNTFTNQTFSSYPTTISFTANPSGEDIRLKGVTSPPSDPGGYKNIGKYVDASVWSATGFGLQSSGSWLFLNVSYTDDDLTNAGITNESSMRLAKNNGTWYTDPAAFADTYNVDTTNNYVYANITTFGSTFAPLGFDSFAIDSCKKITSAGYYRLINSISNSNATKCIEITSSDVIFDGQSYTIDGIDGGGTSGVYAKEDVTAALTNITVANVTLTDWGNGVYYDNIQNGGISTVSAYSNVNGIYLTAASNSNNLTSNHADSNTQYGIYLSSSNSNTLTVSSANSNTQYGIYLSSSNSNTLTSNSAKSNTQYGLYLFNSNNNVLTGNSASTNSGDDIYLYMASNNTFTNQTLASYTTIASFTYLGDYALKGVASPPSNPGSFRNISKYVDIVVQGGTALPSGQQLSWGGSGWFFLNVSYAHSDLTGVNESTLFMAKNNGTWYTDPAAFASSYGRDTTNNYVYANITTFGSTFAPLGESGPINISGCANLTWAGSTYTLNTSLSGNQSSGRCIDIQADNITFDCANYNIIGGGGGPSSWQESGGGGGGGGGQGIYAVGRTNIIVKNCANISNYATGVYLSNVNQSTITNNQFYFNPTGGGDASGLHLTNSYSNNITSNTANHNDYGIYLNYSSNNNLTNNTANSNTNTGIYLLTSTDNIFVNNTVSSNPSGFLLSTSSNSNTLTNNTVSGNTNGIYLLASSILNNLINNTASSSTYGFYIVTAASNNILTNNTAKSDQYGFYFSSSNSNTLTSNNASANTNTGIYLASSNFNNITSSTTNSNTNYGIYLGGSSSNNNLINNTASSNTNYGIFLDSSSSNNLTNNNANSNPNTGIYLRSSSNLNNIANNNASSNAYGLFLSASNSNTLTSNNASSNSYGIYFTGTSNNNVATNNTASSNSAYDIYFDNSQNNTFTNQTIASYPTVISFVEQMAAGNNMSLKGVTSPPSDPSNYGNMSKYVDANLYIGPSALSSGQQLSSDPHNWLFLNVSYTDADWINAGITNESDIKIAKKTSNWYTDPAAFADTYGIDTINNYVYANLTNFGSIFAPLGKISNISSCPIMDSSGSYRLINNITNSTAPACINITASNVILDCQGYSINGANNLNTQGIKIAPSSGSINNITIQNCIITGWDKGIGIFAGASGVVINNNTFRLNYGSEASAIHIENTTGINITNNNASGNGAVPGIYFYNVNSSLIQNNTANSNQHGIQLVSSNSNTITDNTANSNTNHGIYLSSSSNYNNITNNNANSNTQDGILLMSSSNYNTLTSNNANSNTQYGIHLFGSNNNSLTGNTVSSNSAYDIYLDTTLSTIFTNQQIASYPTTLSFTYLGDYALKGVTSPPSTPEPFRNIGKYVNVVAVSGVGFPSGQQLSGGGGGGWLFLNISYSSSDLTAASVMNESSMRLAKYNGSWYTGPAAFASTYNVNTGANYVYANITSFGSTFAPLGIPPQAFGQVNVSVEPMLSITLVDNLVDFGTGFVTAGNAYADIDSNSTDTGNWTNTSAGIHGWPGNRDFMTLDNNGNVKANVNISAGDSAATFIGGTGPDQWYAAEDNESVSCDGILQSTYTTLGISQTSLCTSLRNNDSTDTINILFKLRVPSDATPSAKTNTITFSAVEA